MLSELIGDYRAASQPLKEAIRLISHASDAFYNLAAAYAHLGEKENAIEWLKKAIQLDPPLASEARKDDDFRSLRSDPDFLALVQP